MTEKVAVWAGAVVLAMVASGCSMEGALSGPDRAAEGRRVSGRLAEVLEVPGGAGVLERVPLRDSVFTAQVRRGVARAGSGVVVAVRGAARPRLRSAFVDSVSGQRFAVEADQDAAGAPWTRLRAVVDGATLVEITRDWRAADGLWVLADERAAVFVGGRRLQVSRRVARVELAAAGPLQRLGRMGRHAAASLLTPGDLHAAQACWKEALEYAAATLALAAASELVLASPEKIAAALVWLAAWEKFNAALHKYATCMEGGAA